MKKNFSKYNLRNKRNQILGLLIECPFQIALSDCPAKELRKLPSLEKFKLIGKMSEKELNVVIRHHKKCSKKREKGLATEDWFVFFTAAKASLYPATFFFIFFR